MSRERRTGKTTPRVEHPRIASRDWRLVAITTVEKEWRSPHTGVVPAGTPVEVSCQVNLHQKTVLLPAPSPVALFLSVARKHRDAARDYLRTDVENHLEKWQQDDYRLPSGNEAAFFDCLENLQAAVIFSYTAIEAFANESIPNDYVHTVMREGGRCTESYSKEQAERFLGLDVKLGTILPEVFRVSSPKQQKIWNHFKWLQQLRDSLIHLKTRDHRSGATPEYPIFSRLLDQKTLQVTDVATNLLMHFFSGREGQCPRWLHRLQQEG